MTRLAALFLIAAFAGCATRAMDPPDTPQGRCQRDALRDPTVRAATQQTDDAFPTTRAAALAVQLRVTRDAVNRCLAPYGLAEPGGVERVQH